MGGGGVTGTQGSPLATPLKIKIEIKFSFIIFACCLQMLNGKFYDNSHESQIWLLWRKSSTDLSVVGTLRYSYKFASTKF